MQPSIPTSRSSGIWPHVTRQNPCGACGKTDWCQIGDKGFRCYRVESPHPFKGGGWFHPFEASPVPRVRPKPLPVPPSINATKLIKEWQDSTPAEVVDDFASQISVSYESLVTVGTCYAPAHRAFAFPMRDGYGNIIGIRLRSNDGRKWAVRGSRNGIFIPDIDPQPMALLCEGPTSTAAALTLGFYAIGRPACHLGGNDIKIALRRLGVRQAVIVADNDEKPNGLTPGLTGATALAKEIGVRCVIWTPTTKDIRDFLISGGTKAMIEDDLKNFVWKIQK